MAGLTAQSSGIVAGMADLSSMPLRVWRHDTVTPLTANRTRPAHYPNGRVLTDDVFSARMIFMTHGQASPQGVRPHDDLLAHFPYLGPPSP
jgi:hypothetical protein